MQIHLTNGTTITAIRIHFHGNDIVFTRANGKVDRIDRNTVAYIES